MPQLTITNLLLSPVEGITLCPLFSHCIAAQVNMTNGVTPRRWIHCANPALSEIFTKYLGSLVAKLKWFTMALTCFNPQ